MGDGYHKKKKQALPVAPEPENDGLRLLAKMIVQSLLRRQAKSNREPGGAEHWRAGGIMLQTMPKASPLVAAEEGKGEVLTAHDLIGGDERENWNRASILLGTVEELELIGPTVPPTDLLVRLFHEEGPRVFDAQAVRFGCTCSKERVRQSLSIYSAREIGTMIADDGQVQADCQFCGAHYVLDPASVGFEAETSPSD